MSEIPNIVCPMCKDEILIDDVKVKLTAKGVATVNKASADRKDTLSVSVGQYLHELCRKRYTSYKEIAQHVINVKRKSEEDQPGRDPPVRRSQVYFKYEECCILCGELADVDAKYPDRPDKDVYRVRSFDFQKNILAICNDRNDEWATAVKGRVQYVSDLHAADAIYHKVCDSNFRTGKNIPNKFKSTIPEESRGRPSNTKREEAFHEVVANFRMEDEFGQTTVHELVRRMSNINDIEPYSAKYMKQKLLEEFENEVEISSADGKVDVVTFKESVTNILHHFYESPKSDEQSDAIRIITTAARLLKCDIKKLETNKQEYPTPECVKLPDEMVEYLPRSLTCFLELISSGVHKQLKIASIGQCIIQLSRPRGVLTPLQFGLGIQVHHQYGSKHLIQTLSNMGFCCSYNEIINFERCAASQSVNREELTTKNSTESHCEYVGDNVDHNPRTLDGKFSLHVMGLIRVNTPAVRNSTPIKRNLISSKRYIESAIKIKYYKQPDSDSPLTFSHLTPNSFKNPADLIDLNWKITRPLRPQGGWSGTMQAITKGNHKGKSSVTFLPMIDLEPSNMSCIYTTLCFVVDECKAKQCSPVLTFDQPLYLKAKIIINNESELSDLKQTVLSLGAFHTSMNFVGCICHFMASAGLKEVLEVVYGENAVTHMLSGKAYERAIRGLFLVDSVVHFLLLSEAYGISTERFPVSITSHVDDNNQLPAQELHADLVQALKLNDEMLNNDLSVDDLKTNETLLRIKNVIETQMETSSQYPTAKLWVQFMTMMDMLRNFIRSERTADWRLHTSTLQAMLPYFAAAGHNHYTKSVWLYLQDMIKLPETHPDLYQRYMEGLFVVRRSDRFWAGLAKDLTIEQTLMRTMKSVGGLTHGRGVEEKLRLKWLLALPACAEVNSAMQEFTGTYYESSDQHKDLTKARIYRDDADLSLIHNYLRERSPFENCASLRNIASGLNADSLVNAQEAAAIGRSILMKMEGQNALEYSFSRKDQVRTMAAKYSICVDGEPIKVDPQLLFQRMVIIGMDNDDPNEMFEYELASRPSSMFDEYGRMRSAVKPQLADALSEASSSDGVHELSKSEQASTTYHVIDGGALLHKFVWKKKQTFSSVGEMYVKNIKQLENPWVVFDGYSKSTIKQCTQDRRINGLPGPKVDFRGDTVLLDNRERFLSNVENKQRFILFLGDLLEKEGIRVSHATGDADKLIARTSLDCSKRGRTFAVGEDTDLLVLLCSDEAIPVFDLYLKTDKRNAKHKIWNIKRLRSCLGEDLCKLLPLLHAVCGCDTTSRLYSIGKGAALKKAYDKNFQRIAEVFLKSNASIAEIEEAGERIISILYGGKQGETLNKLRYRKFHEKVSTSSTSVEVKSLPPTSDSARFHSRRVYLQVQYWLGRPVDPECWGWKHVNSKYEPILMEKAPAPDRILKVIRCQCKGDCGTKRCSCRKNGIFCTSACTNCAASACTNYPYLEVEDDDKNDEDI